MTRPSGTEHSCDTNDAGLGRSPPPSGFQLRSTEEQKNTVSVVILTSEAHLSAHHELTGQIHHHDGVPGPLRHGRRLV